MKLQEEIERLLTIARSCLAKAGQRTHHSRINFEEGRIAAYELCLDFLSKERESDVAKQFAVAVEGIGTPCPKPDGDPTSLSDSVTMLDKVYGFLRDYQSTQITSSRKWRIAVQSRNKINEAIRLIEQVTCSSTEQNGTPCPKSDSHEPYLSTDHPDHDKQDLHLDVELDKARALHRVWRALNDGDCPKCHVFRSAANMFRYNSGAIECPNCKFVVNGDEIVAIQELFAPAMNAAVAIFEKWREDRLARKGDASCE